MKIQQLDAPIQNLVTHEEPLFMASPTIHRDDVTGEFSIIQNGLPWTLRNAMVTILMFPEEGRDEDIDMDYYNLAHKISTHCSAIIELSESDTVMIEYNTARMNDSMPLMIRGAVKMALHNAMRGQDE